MFDCVVNTSLGNTLYTWRVDFKILLQYPRCRVIIFVLKIWNHRTRSLGAMLKVLPFINVIFFQGKTF